MLISKQKIVEDAIMLNLKHKPLSLKRSLFSYICLFIRPRRRVICIPSFCILPGIIDPTSEFIRKELRRNKGFQNTTAVSSINTPGRISLS